MLLLSRAPVSKRREPRRESFEWHGEKLADYLEIPILLRVPVPAKGGNSEEKSTLGNTKRNWEIQKRPEQD